MFKEERQSPQFDWAMIGDIGKGRPNLGGSMEVAVYRLMQFTMRDTMIRHLGVESADRVIYESGQLAGQEFCKALVTSRDGLSGLLDEAETLLRDLKIGILRIEKFDPEKEEITLTVAEDLDCSGMVVCDENICTYDEGFLSGLLTQYTGRPFQAREVDCWCSGDRVCRFEIKPLEE